MALLEHTAQSSRSSESWHDETIRHALRTWPRLDAGALFYLRRCRHRGAPWPGRARYSRRDVHLSFSSCRCGRLVGLDEEIGGIFQLALIFWISKGKASAPSQDFGRARTRAENICKLRLDCDPVPRSRLQHIHRVEPAPAPEGPTPSLIGLDQRGKNIELIAPGVPMGAPQSFSISARALRWSLSVRIGRICMVVIIKIWRRSERQ